MYLKGKLSTFWFKVDYFAPGASVLLFISSLNILLTVKCFYRWKLRQWRWVFCCCCCELQIFFYWLPFFLMIFHIYYFMFLFFKTNHVLFIVSISYNKPFPLYRPSIIVSYKIRPPWRWGYVTRDFMFSSYYVSTWITVEFLTWNTLSTTSTLP